MAPRSGEQLVASGDARICAEAFGQPGDAPILLIGGAAASMDFWEDEFCLRLADAGRYVVRYDFRDTGRSTSYPPGEPGYTGADLMADALAVLDGFSLRAAHVVGVSMGGAIAQRLALDHAERVATLVLQSTTPAVDGPQDRPDLPPVVPRLAASLTTESAPVDWADRDAAVDAMLAGQQAFAGSVPLDVDRVRRIAARCYDRTTDMAAMQTNHWILDDGEPTRKLLGDITAPTLVLHGTEDPLFPYGHGRVLASEIAGARLVPLPGMGHQYPPEPLWDLVIDEIIAHTAMRSS